MLAWPAMAHIYCKNMPDVTFGATLVVTSKSRIICAEGVARDAVMINHALRQAGLAFRSKRVDTKNAFLHELEHSPPDVILSDHGLPEFDGFTALAIARDKCPDIPFIFVTNSLGEEFAIETFESGATDYVIKTNLAKLAPAVNRALERCEERSRLKQQEQKLRESEERFRMLVEGVKDYAIFMLDCQGQVTSWNSGAEWIHGFRASEALNQNFSLFYTSNDIKLRRPEFGLNTAAAEGRFEEQGLRLAKGGKSFWADVVITALRGTTGQLCGYAQVTRDISDQKKAEEALKKSEAIKTEILDTALDAILSIDHEGKVQEWNRAAESMFGYKRSEALGRSLDQLVIPPAMRRLYQDGLSDYLMTGAASLLGRPIHLTLRRKDGSEFQAEMAVSRIATEAPPRCTALIRDITERKEAESSLRRSEERLRLLIENVKDYAIYLLDPAGNVATWNAGAQNIEGYQAGEILGKPLATFFTPEDRTSGAPQAVLKRAEREGRAVNQGWCLRKDGSQFWCEAIITALRDEAGKLYGFSKVARDMTESKKAEEENRRLNDELEQRVRDRTAQLEAANTELEAFSYSISHDLRAPLRHIAGYIEILQAEAGAKLDEVSAQYLQIVADSARRLGELIDALLVFSRASRAVMRRGGGVPHEHGA